MRTADKVERFRLRQYSDESYGMNGAFLVPCGDVELRVIASDQAGWDHVSVSLADRCPTWDEMSYIRRLFFRGDETVMQLHVPEARHLNHHPYCLHLWRPQQDAIPLPPDWMVAPTIASARDIQ